ncbi:ABC transporter ATP-binding protein [Solicola gregarius]|uniref:Fatty acid ABC transporter ATP-binding/permease protein n=1 Tax=Solicola gregarius TaxID=2908642 RepID=A0AA46TGJ4_9ACTN|nr:ABC transporter ATP-binding protein [Solicola gregarius]UYM04957.1 ABC transporter ATP-binding protein/permease [Solicola gregarius]
MNPGTWRSMTNDPSVLRQRVAPGTTRRILQYARPYRAQITAFLVLVVLTAGLTVATPLLFKSIIDDGVVPGDTSVVVILSSIVALLAFIEAGLALAQRYFSARLGEGLIYDLRSEVFDHVQRMPLSFFTRSQTGALVSRLNNDVIGAQRAFTSTLSGVVSNVISLALVVGTMLILSWQITLVAFLLVPIFLFPAKWAGKRLSGLTREQMEVNADLGGTMTERFQVGGAMTVKLFGRPDEERDGFDGQAARVRDLGVRIAMTSRIFFSAMTLVAALATALVYGIGGVMGINGVLTVGTLLALAALMGRLYGPLTSLTNVHVDIMTALVSFERVFEVLDLPQTIRDADNAVDLPDDAPASVELDQVHFGYDDAEASLASLEGVARSGQSPSGEVLHDISFAIEPGEMVALVGHSGAGKTTVSALLARLYDVDSGAVLVGGRDVRQLRQDSLRDTIGYVAQDPFMFHDTIRANLLYASPDATDDQMRAALSDAQILDLVDALPDGLDTVVGDRGHRLSGGERQRLAIARLMLKGPRVVVLDEATAHLDSESERAVQAALDRALAGRTSLVIAHRLSTVRNADSIVVLDAGRVVEQGTHTELLAREGTYAELYRTQFATETIGAAG